MSSTAAPAVNNTTAAQTGPNATSSSTGTTSPLAAVPAQPTARLHATAANKKNPSPPAIASSSPAVAVGSSPAQHGKSSSVSPVNGKNQISPAVPSVGNPSIATNNNAPNWDHSRKPSSVTISGAGSGGYMGNGGPVAANSRPNMVFGSMPTGGASPAPAHSTPNHTHASSLHTPFVNPRVTSPSASPSPIPQPAASGGRPSLGLQGQNNVPNFGSINDNSNNVSFPLIYTDDLGQFH